MVVEAIIAGIGAILTAAGGVALVVREFRRRDRRYLQAQVDKMTVDLHHARTDAIACRKYAFTLVEILAEHGIDHPPVPAAEPLA